MWFYFSAYGKNPEFEQTIPEGKKKGPAFLAVQGNTRTANNSECLQPSCMRELREASGVFTISLNRVGFNTYFSVKKNYVSEATCHRV